MVLDLGRRRPRKLPLPIEGIQPSAIDRLGQAAGHGLHARHVALRWAEPQRHQEYWPPDSTSVISHQGRLRLELQVGDRAAVGQATPARNGRWAPSPPRLHRPRRRPGRWPRISAPAKGRGLPADRPTSARGGFLPATTTADFAPRWPGRCPRSGRRRSSVDRWGTVCRWASRGTFRVPTNSPSAARSTVASSRSGGRANTYWSSPKSVQPCGRS